MTTLVCFELLIYICIVTVSWKRRLQKLSTSSCLTVRKEIRQSFKVITRMTFQKLKPCCSSIFFYMTLISLPENSSVKSHVRENFPYERPLNEEQLWQEFIGGKLFGYVQCDIKVHEFLRRFFSNFPPILKNTVVSGEDVGTLMREYAAKEDFMAQPRRILISNLHLTNGTIISPLLFLLLKLRLVCKKFIVSFKNFPKSVSTPSYSLP